MGCVPGLVCSLLHEFSHLVLRTEGLCDVVADDRPRTEDRLVEARCNAIARSLWALIEEAISAVRSDRSMRSEREFARRDDGKRWADTNETCFPRSISRYGWRTADSASGPNLVAAGWQAEVPPTRS